MEKQGIREALATSHLFSELSEEQMERVRRHSHITDMLEGESLFFQGDDATSFYLVLSGRIKLFRVSPEGKEKVVEIMEANATFAEALMFMDQPHYPVTATALSPSRVIGINCRDFKAMLRESVDTCFLLLGSMSFRLRGLIREIDALSLDTGTVRTVAYLLNHAPEDHSLRLFSYLESMHLHPEDPCARNDQGVNTRWSECGMAIDGWTRGLARIAQVTTHA